jgi:cytochrome c oxidase subunit 2
MAENTEANRDAKQGMALALAIWIITIVSVAYFFKYGLPDLASTRAAQDTLYYVILVLTGFFYVAVQGFLGLYVWKYRHRDDAEGSYWHDSHKLEMSWTIGTAVILIPVVFAGLLIWQDVKAAPPEGDMLTIEAVAAQFQWDFRYPGPDGEFAAWRPELYSLENYLGVEAGDPAGADDIHMINQLVIPVDQPVRILLRSKDVQHAFFLPNHRVKQDVMPGIQTMVWFTPTVVGEYEIACAELCGLGHYRMRAFLSVRSEADYQAWLTEQANQ